MEGFTYQWDIFGMSTRKTAHRQRLEGETPSKITYKDDCLNLLFLRLKMDIFHYQYSRLVKVQRQLLMLRARLDMCRNGVLQHAALTFSKATQEL